MCHLSNKYQKFLGFGRLLKKICWRIFIHYFTIECDKSFSELNTRLTTTSVLTLLDGLDGNVIYCDASGVNLGCLLMRGDYDMNVLYHPGKANVVVDALSRLSMGSVAHVEEEKK
ncbi:hypothetical protein MTR67_044105 [Solanum verrucosum]|uniref:Reverse transcriptase/retrotransposon-derived protein RNase H-like domain-containing protein n=1 Tax=Solanum verrucosum TaxID=315347 RepID=A0AAF0ZVB7_SOLVR|nr:hypothetical protein MTR67_044105 [Solanum verrucosum]